MGASQEKLSKRAVKDDRRRGKGGNLGEERASPGGKRVAPTALAECRYKTGLKKKGQTSIRKRRREV